MSLNAVENTILTKINVLFEKILLSHSMLNEHAHQTQLDEKLMDYKNGFEQLMLQLQDEEIDTEAAKQKAVLNRGDREKIRFTQRNKAPLIEQRYSVNMTCQMLESHGIYSIKMTQELYEEREKLDFMIRRKDQIINKATIIEDQISRLTKQLIEEIEDQDISLEFINACKQNDIFEILYHNPVIGDYSFTYLEKRQLHGIFFLEWSKVMLMLCAASITFYATVASLGLGGAWLVAGISLLTSAMIYMGGLMYGIMNDLFATKANLPYFLLGHTPDQKSFFTTNDPTALAVGWGIIGTNGQSMIAAVLFGIITAFVTGFSSTHVLIFALPLLIASLPVMTCIANFVANRYRNHLMDKDESLSAEKLMQVNPEDNDSIKDENIDFISTKFMNFVESLNDYTLQGLEIMNHSNQSKASWMGNGVRNAFGYLCIPLLAIVDITLMLALQSAPEFLYGSLFSVTIPVVSAFLVLGFLMQAQRYLMNNQDTQIDNRYKLKSLDTSSEISPDELYITDAHISSLRS